MCAVCAFVYLWMNDRTNLRIWVTTALSIMFTLFSLFVRLALSASRSHPPLLPSPSLFRRLPHMAGWCAFSDNLPCRSICNENYLSHTASPALWCNIFLAPTISIKFRRSTRIKLALCFYSQSTAHVVHRMMRVDCFPRHIETSRETQGRFLFRRRYLRRQILHFRKSPIAIVSF